LWASALCLVPGLAHAGAFGRPNQIDARAVGIGGAFTAVADDPSAVWFNPAGLAQIRATTLQLGLDLVSPSFKYTPQSCTPGGAPSTSCASIESAQTAPLPTIGFSTRFAGKNGNDPSRLAVGFGTFVTMGGVADFDSAALKQAGEQPGIIHSRLAMLELVPAAAYKVNDALLIGA